MSETDTPVIVYVTCPDLATAELLGRELVEMRLAACANILPGMTSIYRWQGTIEQSTEAVLLLKTRSTLAEGVIEAVVARHPYETPAVLRIDVTGGAAGYLAWLDGETR
ncbi:MAG: divalent-cation tolerance protein CutA [Hyphomicrobiaceae bacterium]|nr:divalent-cation tolerance protein CutA [Hyphomicrobiaceae bacterium]